MQVGGHFDFLAMVANLTVIAKFVKQIEAISRPVICLGVFGDDKLYVIPADS
jgi:hypothetical protein